VITARAAHLRTINEAVSKESGSQGRLPPPVLAIPEHPLVSAGLVPVAEDERLVHKCVHGGASEVVEEDGIEEDAQRGNDGGGTTGW
jgi:hypothetical protein